MFGVVFISIFPAAGLAYLFGGGLVALVLCWLLCVAVIGGVCFFAGWLD